MSLKDARSEILSRLVILDAAGEEGFEGLLRDAMAEVTGMGFHLSKSGPQGGADVRTDPSNGVQIGLEAKRYRQSTRLPLDQLKAKIIDAADQPRPPDVWVLAASRSISGTDREALMGIADKQGLGLLVLDWPGGASHLPDLAVLLAAAPGALATHLPSPPLDAAFAVIRNHADYDNRLAGLRASLTAATAGYAAATRSVAAWLTEAQTSKANALSRLRGYNNLAESGVAVASRPAIYAGLDGWWDAGSGSLGLLGDEGVGKTWAALSWIAYRARDDRSLPLTVFLSARDVEGRNPEAILAQALAAQTGLKTAEFWSKRLRLWKRAGANGPRFLVVIDGLNQNWLKKDWNDLLQPLFEDGWHGRFNVLVTCWPDTWQSLNALAPLAPPATSLTVLPFTDPELDEFLRARGLARDDFTSDLLELMKVPRLSLLALESRARLEGSGDITAERLAYEDWRHRLERGSAGRGWSDAEFKALVGELGKEFQRSLEVPTVSRKDLLDRLAKDSGKDGISLASTLSDLIAGRWLEPAGKVNHFKINARLAPFALGLALSADLASLTDEDAARSRIADFLDPFKGQSLAVGIIRAAATAALLDSKVARPVRRALLMRWLEEQNFSQRDFQAWWRLIGADPALFCDLVEVWWLDRRAGGGFFIDEVLIKGFANASEFVEFGDFFRRRVTRWLGWVWVEPDDEVSIRRRVRGDASLAVRTAEIEQSLLDWRTAGGASAWPELELRDSGDVSWLSHRVIGVLSYVKVAPFVPALLAWSLSRAVIGESLHFMEVAWLLRLNTRDPDETRVALLTGIDQLTALEGQHGKTAAVWLLRALGDPESAVQAEGIERGLGGDYLSPDEPVRTADIDPVLDPAQTIETPRLDEIRGSALWCGQREPSDVNVAFETAELALARADPDRLRTILGDAARSASGRSIEDMDGLVRQIPSLLLALDPDEREAIALAMDAAMNSSVQEVEETPVQGSSRWRAMRVLLRIWDCSLDFQLEVLTACGFDLEVVSRVRPALVHPEGDAIEQSVLGLPREGEAALMQGVLAYASEVGLGEHLTTWEPLEGLVLSDDVTVRHLALRLASESGNLAALRAFEATGWSVAAETGREDRAYGSMALLEASRKFSEPALMSRADPEIWGWALGPDPDDVQAIAGFHAFIQAQVDDLERKGTRSIPQYAWDLHRAVNTVVEKALQDVLSWFRPWLETHKAAAASGLYESFPLVDLCRALLRHSPEDGIALWRVLRGGGREGFMKNGDVPLLPLGMHPGQIPQNVATELLDDLNTDAKLKSLVFAASRNNQGDWLSSAIKEDVLSREVRRQARGWRLLGYCDAIPPFSELWTELKPPSHGWLAEVVSLARAEYERNIWAKHWRQALIKADTRTDAHAAYRLLQGAMDQRIGTWNNLEAFETSLMGPVLRGFWELNRKTLEATLQERRKSVEQLLYGLDVMRWTQAPWL